MRLPDEFLIAGALSAMVVAPSALGVDLLGRSAPSNFNFAAPAIEEVVTLDLVIENEPAMPLSAETVMLNQLFDFGNP